MKIGPKYKIARRLGSAVFDKTQTQKFAQTEGKMKKGGKKKQLSEYGLQLIEKQKIRFTYNVAEKQFSNYVKEAIATKGVNSADMLQELLEVRLDNVVYRIGLAPTRQASRQMVSHGHFTVNGKRVTTPSFRLKIGDKIAVREGSKKSILFADVSKKLEKAMAPAWLSFNAGTMEGMLKSKPTKEGALLDFARVLEFYSR
jgi:small subunit ribosomal protein S4